MEYEACDTNRRYHYPHLTDEVMARGKTDELLEEIITATINAATDFDMFATGKTDAGRNDHESSYWYFRDILNRLGISSQAIVDVIDECCPNNQRDNLTECSTVSVVAS